MIPKIDIAYTKGIERGLVDNVVLNICKYVPNFNFSSPKMNEQISPNSGDKYFLQVGQEFTLEPFYEETKSKQLFLLDKMLFNFHDEIGRDVIEPSRVYWSPDRQKTIFVVSTHRLENNSSRIAKLAIHEILHDLFEENNGVANYHCEDASCIMQQIVVDPYFRHVNNAKEYYKVCNEKLDKRTGFCDYHQTLVDKLKE